MKMSYMANAIKAKHSSVRKPYDLPPPRLNRLKLPEDAKK
jgi:hypothetical protein